MFDVIKKGIVPAVVAQLPFEMLHRWTGRMLLLPYYHGVSDEEVSHVRHLYRFRTVRQFKLDLDDFLRTYQPVTLRELLACVAGRRVLPPTAFMVSFDDGFREIHDVIAPILLDKGVAATFFIIESCLDNADMAHHNKISLLIEHLQQHRSEAAKTSVLELLAARGIHGATCEAALLQVDYANRDVLEGVARLLEFDFKSYLTGVKPYLTSEQVRKLISLGFTIGGHSMDHPLYAKLALSEQLRQTRESVRFVRDRFDLDYGAFAFPHHDTGVSRQFFDDIYADGEVDISFGTSGLLQEENIRHFQRFPMEKTAAAARRIVGYNYARCLQKKLLGRQTIIRR